LLLIGTIYGSAADPTGTRSFSDHPEDYENTDLDQDRGA
jgi:hypothetical protein